MEENLLGFVMWCAVGGFFLGMAVYGWFAKKPVGFWANTEMFEVTDVRKYNQAFLRLWGSDDRFGDSDSRGGSGVDYVVGCGSYGGDHCRYGGLLSCD